MNVKNLESSLQSTTKGAWDYTIGADGTSSVYGNCRQDDMSDADLIAHGIKNEDDAIFIARAHNLMPTLLEAMHLLKMAAHALEAPGDFSPEELRQQVIGDIGRFLSDIEQGETPSVCAL